MQPYSLYTCIPKLFGRYLVPVLATLFADRSPSWIYPPSAEKCRNSAIL